MPSSSTSRQDDDFRQQIVDLILAGAVDPAFCTQAAFAAWSRKHKKLLVALFSGQGIQRIARVIAWISREQTGRRRAPPEALCRLADHLARGTSEELPFATLDAALRAALLSSEVAATLLAVQT